jgi:FtsZ-binding cell division protein ZapB
MVNFKNLFKRKPDERVDALIEVIEQLRSEVKVLKVENEHLYKEVEELKQVCNEDDGVDAQQVMDEYFRGAKGDYR